MLEQGTQAPSPAPDLIPAKTKNQENSHWDWYSKRGHFSQTHGGSKTRARRERNQCVRHIDRFMLVLRDRDWGAAGQSKGLLTSGHQHWPRRNGIRAALSGDFGFIS